jgi:hypothetical protein
MYLREYRVRIITTTKHFVVFSNGRFASAKGILPQLRGKRLLVFNFSLIISLLEVNA